METDHRKSKPKYGKRQAINEMLMMMMMMMMMVVCDGGV